MLQAVASPGGGFIAQVSTSGELQVSTLPAEQHDQFAFTQSVKLGGGLDQAFLPEIQSLSWAHSTIEIGNTDRISEFANHGIGIIRTWLLLASKHRLVIVQLDLPANRFSASTVVEIVADLEFPESYGKISATDFVCDYQSILLLFEIAPHASLLSLAQAQREDIPDRKFATKQSYCLRQARLGSEQSKFISTLALLTRDKHSDVIVVIDQGKVTSSFKIQTVDAQGVIWCPDESPLLAVWDSAAHGTKLTFFTPFGHSLRSLDISGVSSIFPGLSADFGATGISTLDWVHKAGSRTVSGLAFGDGNKNILMRTQDSKSLAMNTYTFHHPKTLRVSKTAIWQELGSNQYEFISGDWNLEGDSVSEVDIVAVSADCCKIASKVCDAPNVVFIWDINYKDPVAAILLQKDVRQLLWNPHSSKLLVMASDSTVGFHYWTDVHKAPTRIFVPRLQKYSSSRWHGQWIASSSSFEDAASSKNRSLFMLSSKSHFDVLQPDNSEDGCFSSCFDLHDSSLQRPIPPLQSLATSANGESDTSSMFF